MRTPTVASPLPGHGGPRAYVSRFVGWDDRASVRVKPRRAFEGTRAEKCFFPPELVPAAEHPLVRQHGPAATSTVLIHMLCQYLHFTTILEQTAVLPVTSALSVGRGGILLPEAMRADAFKITTDEAWHAQFSYEFVGEVARHTGVAPTAVTEPTFVGELNRLSDAGDPGHRRPLGLVFAVVSETLISALLSDMPRDTRLPEPVRAVVADHAVDEGRHHAYFQSFLRLLWPSLDRAERAALGPLLPELINVFLRPDLSAVRAALVATGLSEAEAHAVIEDSYPVDSPLFAVGNAAAATVRAFTEVGALQDPATLEAFQRAGLANDS